MNTLIAIYLFVIGAIFGSFALAMADRLHNRKDFVKGRSECDDCKKQLAARDLIPILSWLYSRGKCRFCHKKLTIMYPLTEIILGLLFVASFVFWPYELSSYVAWSQFIVWVCALVLMCVLFIYDLRWFKLPFKVVNPLIGLGVVWAMLDIAEQGLSNGIIVQYILGLLVGAGVFQLLYSVSKGKWIGDGDIRLGIAIGLFTGSAFEAWFTIFLASVLGLLFAFPTLLKTKNKKMKLKMPFGPPLLLALIVTVLFGAQIIEWYKVTILYL